MDLHRKVEHLRRVAAKLRVTAAASSKHPPDVPVTISLKLERDRLKELRPGR
jgi:hypothetical protein